MKKLLTLGILIIGSLFMTQSVFAEFNFTTTLNSVLTRNGQDARIEKGIKWEEADKGEKITIVTFYKETFSNNQFIKSNAERYFGAGLYKDIDDYALDEYSSKAGSVYMNTVYTETDIFKPGKWYSVYFSENQYSNPPKSSNIFYVSSDQGGKLIAQTTKPASPIVTNQADLFKFTDYSLVNNKTITTSISLKPNVSSSDITASFIFIKGNGQSYTPSTTTLKKITANYTDGNGKVSPYKDKIIYKDKPVNLFLDLEPSSFPKETYYSVDVAATNGSDTYTGIDKYLLVDSNGAMSLQSIAPTAVQIAALKVAPATNGNGGTNTGNNTGGNGGSGTGNTGGNGGSSVSNDGSGGGSVIKLKNPLKFDSIPAILGAIVTNVVLPIAIPIFIIMLIYCGIKFVLARGNPDALKEAREALKWTLIGGAVILGAYAIAELVAGTIGAIVGK